MSLVEIIREFPSSRELKRLYRRAFLVSVALGYLSTSYESNLKHDLEEKKAQVAAYDHVISELDINSTNKLFDLKSAIESASNHYNLK